MAANASNGVSADERVAFVDVLRLDLLRLSLGMTRSQRAAVLDSLGLSVSRFDPMCFFALRGTAPELLPDFVRSVCCVLVFLIIF
jgi:hypothetical protein